MKRSRRQFRGGAYFALLLQAVVGVALLAAGTWLLARGFATPDKLHVLALTSAGFLLAFVGAPRVLGALRVLGIGL